MTNKSNIIFTRIILVIFIILCVIFIASSIMSATKEYPESNVTITVIEKYDPSWYISGTTPDGIEHQLIASSLKIYMSMHQLKTYNVTISLRSDNLSEPIWSEKYNYITKINGDIK